MQEMQETLVQALRHEDPLGEEMATHSSVLAWRIPGMAGPGGLPSMGSHRVGHPPFVPSKRLPDWASLELSPSVESCGCGLGPSPVRLG